MDGMYRIYHTIFLVIESVIFYVKHHAKSKLYDCHIWESTLICISIIPSQYVCLL